MANAPSPDRCGCSHMRSRTVIMPAADGVAVPLLAVSVVLHAEICSTGRQLLELSGYDLSAQMKNEIMTYDNGDWRSTQITHWCLPECPCGRSRQVACERMQAVIGASIGPSAPLALEYRWKHMEKARRLDPVVRCCSVERSRLRG